MASTTAGVPHPIPYQGSKRALAAHILPHVPGGCARLIEPFAGSAAVTLAAAAADAAGSFAISDLNEPLMRLWQAIIDAPEDVARRYAQLWTDGDAVARYYEVRTAFNTGRDPAYLLYLLVRCVKNAVRYNAAGEFNQSPDKRRLGTRPAAMRKQLLAAGALLAGRSTVATRDYRDVFATATRDDLLYLDPPYQGTSGPRDQRYVAGLPFAEFVAALEDLNRRGVRYILSYDGQTGARSYGEPLPEALDLHRLDIDAGRSAQATLLGRTDRTIEALYLSPGLHPQAAVA